MICLVVVGDYCFRLKLTCVICDFSPVRVAPSSFRMTRLYKNSFVLLGITYFWYASNWTYASNWRHVQLRPQLGQDICRADIGYGPAWQPITHHDFVSNTFPWILKGSRMAFCLPLQYSGALFFFIIYFFCDPARFVHFLWVCFCILCVYSCIPSSPTLELNCFQGREDNSQNALA